MALNEQIAGAGAQAQQVVSDGAQAAKQLTCHAEGADDEPGPSRKIAEQIERPDGSAVEDRARAKLAALAGARGEARDSRARPAQTRRGELIAQARRAASEQAAAQQQASAADRRSSSRAARTLQRQSRALAQQAAAPGAEASPCRPRRRTLQRAGRDAAEAGGRPADAGRPTSRPAAEQAEQQQKQAEQLQKQLTDDAHRRPAATPRGTDPRLVNLQNALTATAGVAPLVSPPQINKPGDAAVFSVIADHRARRDETADLVETLRDVRDPAGRRTARTSTSYVGGYTARYVDLAALISDAAAPGDRDRDPARLPAADDRVPLAAGPAAGGGHQPALGRPPPSAS